MPPAFFPENAYSSRFLKHGRPQKIIYIAIITKKNYNCNSLTIF